MPIRIKEQTSYYVTRSSVVTPAEPGEVDALARSLRSSGKMEVTYNCGGIQNIWLEQWKRILSDQSDEKIREILGIGSRLFNGD